MIRMGTGRAFNADEWPTGFQNLRRYSPHGVSGPVWVSNASSSGTLR